MASEDPVFDPGLLKKKKKKKKVMVALDDDEAAPQEEVATPAPEPGRFFGFPLGENRSNEATCVFRTLLNAQMQPCAWNLARIQFCFWVATQKTVFRHHNRFARV